MANLLYYPYINLPKTDWTIRTLLYYDHIGSIVPEQYFHNPELYDPFMREMLINGLVTPINPMEVLNHWDISNVFIEYLQNKRNHSMQRKVSIVGRRDNNSEDTETQASPKNSVRLHTNKFDYEVFAQLTEMGLAKKLNGSWYLVEKQIAHELMTFLATVISNKLDYQPISDKIETSLSINYINNKNLTIRTRQCKRDIILKNLIPFPNQIDIFRLQQFKDKHYELLESFRRKVELIVLNPIMTPETPLFQATLEDMYASKEELCARMNESRLGDIIFGTICGTIAAGIGLLANPVVGGIPGFLNAIYSACRIEKPEDVRDQTGLKYLALVDKRLTIKRNSPTERI